MDFFDLVHSRHSIRKFKDKPVPEELITKVLNAARRAPSAGNLQSYEVVIVKRNQEALSKAAMGQASVLQAPVVLVFFADINKAHSKYLRRAQLYALQDATIACTYAQLMVTELGLASVWVGAFNDERVKELCNTDLRPVALLPIGYANEEPVITDRRELKEFVHNEKIKP